MQDTTAIQASQLKLGPLFKPEAVPFTFETVGWKVLGVILLVTVIIFSIEAIKKYIKNKYRREALSQLNNANAFEDILIILKQVAIHAYGRKKVGALFGEKWFSFLDDTGKNVDFSKHKTEILKAAYQNTESQNQVTTSLKSNAKKWIESHA